MNELMFAWMAGVLGGELNAAMSRLADMSFGTEEQTFDVFVAMTIAWAQVGLEVHPPKNTAMVEEIMAKAREFYRKSQAEEVGEDN